MADFPEELGYKPYMGLKKVVHHRWGALRVWPKWRSLKKLWGKEKVGEKSGIEKVIREFGETVSEAVKEGERESERRQKEREE